MKETTRGLLEDAEEKYADTRGSNRSISSEAITYAAPCIMQAVKRETDG